MDVQARFVNALRAQAKMAGEPQPEALPCPFCTHQGRLFQSVDQLFAHAKFEHTLLLEAMGEPNQARAQVKNEALKLMALEDPSSSATSKGGSTPDLTVLPPLETGTGRQSPPYTKKRPTESEFLPRRGRVLDHTGVFDPDFRRDAPNTIVPERTRPNHTSPCLFDPRQSSKGAARPYRSTSEPNSEWSVEANRSHFLPSHPPSHLPSSHFQLPHRKHIPQPKPKYTPQRQPGLFGIQRYDSRYPSLLLQPDSRPISQEQLASEVKSIYAGLTMVETKCIHVDRAQAAAAQDNDPNAKLGADHWQALIALHRTLLHEHHDFFLASQHPSASPALRRLASKYSMPARMWKHGMHSFLELLRRRLPESIDYMLAFIYLAYQMMALLYETVPAFEDTWIECLGDLGRYRMAIEDEDLRDRETWTNVARSWYSKAADKNPTVGRLYHHLAILARPNTLQQLYYYARSLTCVKPFPSARESILTLLDPILGRPTTSYSHALPINLSFIQAHGLLFENLTPESFEEARLWYSEAANKNLPVGRSYHQLTILARPNALKQLYYYARSLTRIKPFSSACETIVTLLDQSYTPIAETAMHYRDLCYSAITARAWNTVLDLKQVDSLLPASPDLRASPLALRIPLLLAKQRQSPLLGFASGLFALNFLIPGAEAQSPDTATNSNWRQRAIDMLSEILVAGAVLVAPMIILVIIGSIAAALLWAEAEGKLAFFMLITSIVFASIRPDVDSAAEESNHYIRLAVGLGYVMLMLAYCRVVMMQPKSKKALNYGRSKKHGRIFLTIATILGMAVTIIFMAFSGSREYWKALTNLNPIFALALATPLSFFLCDLASNIARVVNLHDEDEKEGTAMLSELSQLEAGESSAISLEDMSMRRFHHLYRDSDISDAQGIDSIRFSDNKSSMMQQKRPLIKRFGAWISDVFRKRKAI